MMAGALRMLVLLFVATCTGPALAGLTEADLSAVAFVPPPGARLELAETWRDISDAQRSLGSVLDGRPALLIPVDYGCRTTCGPAVAIASHALRSTGLSVRDYRLVLFGLDPESSAADVSAFVGTRVDPDVIPMTVALRGDDASLQRFTQALGYSYRRDAEADRFAHPLGAVALTAEGRVVRLLSPLGLDTDDLRLALLEAGEGRIGALGQRLALLCYGFDAVHGIYTKRIVSLLSLLCAATIAAMVFWLVLMQRRVAARGKAT